MFDEIERLQESSDLHRLLSHYAGLVGEDREAWQDRLMVLTGVKKEELIRLHGELIVYGWIDQNTGLTPVLQRGAAPQCYRVTTQGLRALKLVQLADHEREAERVAA